MQKYRSEFFHFKRGVRIIKKCFSKIIKCYGTDKNKVSDIISKTTYDKSLTRLTISYKDFCSVIKISSRSIDDINNIEEYLLGSEISKNIFALDSAKEVAVSLLKEKGLTLSLAESCTGGMCASELVSVSGASEVFFGCVVSYDTSVKENILSVSKSCIERYGVVSAECAAKMSEGARCSVKTDIAMSVTGISGPGGALENKPVGTVYIGISDSSGTDVYRANFKDMGRDKNRKNTVSLMLHILIKRLIESC